MGKMFSEIFQLLFPSGLLLAFLYAAHIIFIYYDKSLDPIYPQQKETCFCKVC